MEYTVFDRGAAVGSASAERRGLYWHIAAECRMETDRIVRLYAHDGEKNVRLGVLMPEDGALRLERRSFSRSVRSTSFSASRAIFVIFRSVQSGHRAGSAGASGGKGSGGGCCGAGADGVGGVGAVLRAYSGLPGGKRAAAADGGRRGAGHGL